jgi:CAAX prenyl protease-like protein
VTKARLRAVASGAAWLVGIGVALQAVRVFVDNPMLANLVGALAVSFVATRAGAPVEAGNALARRRALRGALLAAAAVLAAVLAARIAGAELGFTAPSLTLAYGTAEAAAIAYRDEVWLRGIPLAHLERARVTRPLLLVYGAATGVAAAALQPGASAAGLALVGASGLFFAALWITTRDGWAPIAAHFVWALASESLAGDIFYLGPQAGVMSHGAQARGMVAWGGAAAFAALAVVALRARRRPGEAAGRAV